MRNLAPKSYFCICIRDAMKTIDPVIWNVTRRLLQLCVYVWLAAVPVACTCSGSTDMASERLAMDAFMAQYADSLSEMPRLVRSRALQRLAGVHDSLVRYTYLSVALKTCLMTSDVDSAQLLVEQIKHFTARQPFSPELADLRSECFNMEGNIYARLGWTDSAEVCFRRAYEWRMRGTKVEVIPDILINLADACNRGGKLDVGAGWYRRALLLCDSLGLVTLKKVPIYYGLAQIYTSLRDFEQCDYYYERAARSFEDMQPFEKHIYLNNRGTSYYFRGDYLTAIQYFKQVEQLVEDYPDMVFELNLARLNLGDCFLQLSEADSAAHYIRSCMPFFKETGMTTALYYLDTQRIELALLRNDLQRARELLLASTTPDDIDFDMIHIRNRYLQKYHEEAGNYRQAYHYLEKNNRLDDSIRNERVRMRTADLTLRYQQDSTLMAHKVLFQKQENEVLALRQRLFVILGLTVLAFLTAGFLYLYNKKKRDLLLARNRREVSVLRLENIRNRLSPHFIFNVLNQEMSTRKEGEKQELSQLVKLMRRNLELAEQLCVTLSEELDFVQTYLDLEHRSLGTSFHSHIDIAPDVNPKQVMLPSMMIQIPVENAVKHALRDKPGDRELWITAERRGNGVCICVRDNGGGYRPNSNRRGTGTGLRVIMQTIQIMNAKNGDNAIDVTIHNVELPSGETGCEMMFLLPDGYDFGI